MALQKVVVRTSKLSQAPVGSRTSHRAMAAVTRAHGQLIILWAQLVYGDVECGACCLQGILNHPPFIPTNTYPIQVLRVLPVVFPIYPPLTHTATSPQAIKQASTPPTLCWTQKCMNGTRLP